MKDKVFQNYHKHIDGSNIMTPDSAVKYDDYAKRAKELGHKILSTCEHGFQGMYFDAFKVAKKYNLKLIYGAEAYWVKDRFEKDRNNNHIIIIAKTDKGRKAINVALSEANESGYFYKPRLDLDLIMNLPENDVLITTACIAFWNYGIEETKTIIYKLHSKFKENFMLEVQYQPMELQLQINREILKLSEELGIKMIAGMDSHYIYPEQSSDRNEVLLSKGIQYENEGEFFMDYPDYETAFNRFKAQGIFNDEQIHEFLDNTNILLTFEDFDNIDIFSNRIKLPTLYPNLTQIEKNEKLKQIISKEWNIKKNNIPIEKHKIYQNEIIKELKIIFDTNMTDYFLLDYEIIKDGVKNGGIITGSGRGSAVSFYVNNLLNFTKIDRISSKVKMFPERFMSKSRILQTKSLPDIDFNLGNPDVFIESQKRIFGEEHSYPMIAYGTFKKKSAFKMLCKNRADIDFETANIISSKIEAFEKDYAQLNDDEKDTIDIYDYIDEQYHEVYNNSIVYQGIISDKKPHPCGHLIYDKNIREEIGLIKVKTESTKKETMVCLLDGKSAEDFKFLKNDLLKVDVAKTNHLIAKKLGEEVPTENELIKIVNENKHVWDIYKNGFTLGINQVEKPSTTKKAMKYSPNSIETLCALIAGIRPSFKTMYSIFESRKHFSYGIPSFDKIIRDTGVDESFILYQETIMAVLSFAGFEDEETYSIIKAISKKRDEVFKEIRPKFIENIKKNFIEYDKIDELEASKNANKVWEIIENSSKYGFNASHSYCMAYDSLLGAYYKTKFPEIFFETHLQEYDKKNNKDKIAMLKKDMGNFNIIINDIKFGNKNTDFEYDFELNLMNQPISSIKFMNKKIGKEMYELGKNNRYNNFLELLIDIKNKTKCNSKQLNILIKLEYFSNFGKSKYLLDIVDIYDKFYEIKQVNKDRLEELELSPIFMEDISKNITAKLYKEFDFMEIIEHKIDLLENKSISLRELLQAQLEYLGYIEYKNETLGSNTFYVLETKFYGNKNEKPYLKMLALNNGKQHNMKIINNFTFNPFAEGDIVTVDKAKKVPKKKKDADGKWITIPNEFNIEIQKWTVLK